MARKAGLGAVGGSRQPLIEELESRLLFSADFAAGAVEIAPPAMAENVPAQEVVLVEETPARAAEHQRHELVFIDGGLEDRAQLVEDLRARAGEGLSLEIVVLDPERSGIDQIGEVLATHRHDLDAVHVVSHGSEGAVQLGDTWLSNANVGEHAQAIAGWGSALGADADLLFYGCDLAGNSEGLSLVDSLAALTGADVAASSDATGAAGLGGDWDLEHRVGTIETGLAFSTELQERWTHVLAAAVDTSSSGSTADQASVTVSHTTSGSNRLMLVGVAMQPEGESVSSVTYNGTSLTLVGTEENPAGKSRVEIWSLLAPDTGTHDVIVNLSGTGHKGVTVGVMTFTGVNQTNPTLAFSGASGDSTAASTSLASQTDDLVFGLVASHKGTDATPDVGQTEYWDVAVNNANGSGTIEAGAASVTSSWTVNNDKWSVGAVSVQADTNSIESVALSAFQDSYIQASSPTANSGSSGSMIIDRESGDLKRALVQFDLSSIPAGSTITSATVKLQASSIGGLLNIEAYQLLESWVEGSTTWNERSSGSGWSTAGGTYDPTALDSIATDAPGVHRFDITALAQDWLDGAAQNYGVLVASPDGGGNREVTYDSREGTVVPVLEILYEPGNLAPVIAVAGPLAYTENDGAVVVDAIATASDADGLDFDTGTLTVDFTANGTANDRLSIRNQGTGAGQVGVSGSDVSYEGTVVGTFAGGTSGSDPLVVTFDADADATAVQAVLRNVTYQNVSEDPSTSARTLRFVLTDGDGGTSNTETITINVTAQNDAPVLGANALTISEGGTVVLAAANLAATDVDDADASLVFTVSNVTGGQFERVSSGLPVTSFSQADVTASDIRFVHDGGEAAPSYDVTVSDAQPLSDGPAAAAITYTPVNDAPQVANLASETLGYAQGSGPQVIEQGGDALVTDSDSLDFDGGLLRVSFTSGEDPAEDVLSIRDQGTGAGQIGFSGGIVTYEGTTIGTAVGGSAGAPLAVSLDASATPAAVSALARNVTYENTDVATATLGSRSVEFRFDDGDGDFTDVSTIVTVFNANVAPTISGTSAGQTVDDTATRDPFSGVTIGDADVPAQTLTVTVSLDDAAKGVLSNLGSFSDLGGGVYAFVGDAAAATTAIRALTFEPTDNRVAVGGTETTTFTITVSDGIAGPVSDATTTVVSTSINDAPTLGGGSLAAVDEDTAGPPGDTITNLFGAGFADVDAGSSFAGIAVVGNAAPAGEGVWEYSSDGTSWYAVGAVDDTGSALAIQASSRLRFVPAPDWNGVPTDLVLRGLDDTYVAGWSTTSAGESRVTVDTSTPGDPSAIAATTSSLSTSINAVNDAPVLGANALTISEGGSVVLGALDLAATDVDDADPLLTFTVSNVTGGQFELVSAPGSPITAFLQSDVTGGQIRFVHDGGEAAPSYDVTVGDGSLSDGPAAAAISFSNVNDDPTFVNLDGDVLSYTEGDGAVVIDQGAAALLVDPDSADLDNGFFTISIPTGKVGTEDVLSVRNQGTGPGQIGFSGGIVSYEGNPIGSASGGSGPMDLIVWLRWNPSPAAVSALAQNITYENVNTDDPTAGARTVRFIISDGDGGSSPPYFVTVNVAAQNDAPTLGNNALTIAEGGTVVLSSAELSATDVDDADASLVFTVSNVTGGQFERVSSGLPVTSFSQADVTASDIRFVHDGGEAAPSYDVTVSDAQPLADGPAAAAISFSNVNDAPTISGTVAGQTTTDKATRDPFTGVTLDDVDLPGDLLTVDVSLDDPAKGLLTGAFTPLGGGVYRYTGSAAAATAALQGLTFDPSENRVAVGATETTTFTISVSDATAPPVTDSATTVVTTSINDAPTATDVSLTVSENAAAGTLVGYAAAGDLDPGDALTYSIVAGNALGAFAIDPATGAITVADPMPLDFETNPSFTLTVEVRDGSLATDTAAASVTVTDIGETPPADPPPPPPDPSDDPPPAEDPGPVDEGTEPVPDAAPPPVAEDLPLVAVAPSLLPEAARPRGGEPNDLALPHTLREGSERDESVQNPLPAAGPGAPFVLDDAMWRSLELMGADMGRSEAARQEQLRFVVDIAEGGAVAMAAGFLTWFLRGGTLLTSLLSTLPLWSRFDPLPVLNVSTGGRVLVDHDDDDEDEREAGRILDGSQIPDPDPVGPLNPPPRG